MSVEQNDTKTALDLARQLAELNRKNQEANQKIREQSEKEKEERAKEEAERTRALEQAVLEKKLKEENERRKEFFDSLERELEEEKKQKKKTGIFPKKEKKEASKDGPKLSLFFNKKPKEEKMPASEPEVIKTEPKGTEKKVPKTKPESVTEAEPVAETPVTKAEPITETPVTEEPATETEPTTEEPTTEASVTEEPVAEAEPAAKESAPKKTGKPSLLSLFSSGKSPSRKTKGRKEKPTLKKSYPTRQLTHDDSEDKELKELKEKLYPGKYEPSPDGRISVPAADPDQEYIDWKEQAKKSRERLDRDRFRIMLHDVQERQDDVVVMVLITSDMEKLVLLRTLDEFFQFVDRQNYNVVLSYAFVIYKHEDPKYYLEIPDDEHIQMLMGSLYDLFMKNTLVTPNMIGQIPNIGIFQEIYINAQKGSKV
jgi:hypothetical protein